MNKLFLSAAMASLLLSSCINENKKESADTTNVSTLTPPAPAEDAVVDYNSMETPPQYPGGYAAFYKFLKDNIKYPETAKENKIEGSLLASFTIEKDGTLSNIKIDKKEMTTEFADEATRVLKLAEQWEPGMKNGKPVRVAYSIPIKFFVD